MYDEIRMPRVRLQPSPIWSLIGRTLQSQTTRCFCRDQRAPSLGLTFCGLRKSERAERPPPAVGLQAGALIHYKDLQGVLLYQ